MSVTYVRVYYVFIIAHKLHTHARRHTHTDTLICAHVSVASRADLIHKPGHINRDIPPPVIRPVAMPSCLNVSLQPFTLQTAAMMHHVIKGTHTQA